MARRAVPGRVPSAVLVRCAELKASFGFPVSLKKIGGHYYAYKQVIKWDPEARKYVSLESRYLGAISDTGEFRPRKAQGNDLDSARAVIEAKGGKVIMPEEKAASSLKVRHLTDLDKTILTELTMNGRLQLSELAQKLGSDEKRIGYRVRSLEKRLGIEYKPKILIEGLGYLYFIVFARFISWRPDPDALQKDIIANPSIQFAALSSDSKYDLTLIVAAVNDYNVTGGESLPAVLRDIRMAPSLKDIESEWYVSYFDVVKGLMPLRQEFIEKKLLKSVWSRRHERKATSLSKNEYATLRALNADARMPFREIEQKNGMSDGSAKYSFDSLVERSVLQRCSICVPRMPVKYMALVLLEIIDEGAFASTRHELYRFQILEDSKHEINRVALGANMGAPYGVFFMVPVLEDGDLENAMRELYAGVKGIKLSGMTITKVLCGTLPLNRLDNTKTIQHERLKAYEEDQKKK